MKVINEIVKREKDFNFLIPFDGRAYDVIQKGSGLKRGDLIFKREYKKILQTYNLVEELGIKAQDGAEYVSRLDGEYVTKGEILAERIVRAGLAIRKIISTHEGVISLDRLSHGFIDLLSEHVNEDVVADMSGEVIEVKHESGVLVSTNAFVTKYLLGKIDKKIFGRFDVLGDGTSVYTQRDLKEEYSGKIVYLGRFAYLDLIEEVHRRGAKAVVVFAMDYEDFKNTSAPIIVVGGFGNVNYDFRIAKLFSSMNEVQTFIDGKNLAWPDVGQYLLPDLKLKIKETVGINDLVRVLDIENMGKIGRVVDASNQDGYLTISLENGDRLLLHADSLEIIHI